VMRWHHWRRRIWKSLCGSNPCEDNILVDIQTSIDRLANKFLV
jgi:hypothetical protein